MDISLTKFNVAVVSFCEGVNTRLAGEMLHGCHAFFQYSGFQQTAEKCAVCGHLIMEMVRQLEQQQLSDSKHPIW